MTVCRTSLLFLALLSGAASAVLAQGQPLEHSTPTTGANAGPSPANHLTVDDAPRMQFTATPFASHTFEADFSDGPGSVSVSRAGAELSLMQPLANDFRLNISLGAEFSFYDFSTTTPLGTAEPWEDTTQISLTSVLSKKVSDHWTWFFGGGIDLSFEDGADIGEAFSGGLLGGATYRFNDHFSLGGGVAVRSRIEDSGLFLPIVTLDWLISDQWRLSNFNELNSIGLALSYQPVKEFEVSLRAAYQSRAYRLDEDGPIPSGVGRDQRLPIWLQARYNFTPRATLSASVGYVAWQEYTIDNDSGNEVSKEETEGTPFVGVGFSLKF